MREILEKTYKGKRVLVTGHTGFKGSWLSIWLNELGAEVIGYSLDPKSPKQNFVLSNLTDIITDYRGDVRDKNLLAKVFCEHEPEIVFHLAAQPLVGTSYSNPQYTFDVNIMGTVNVLENIKETEATKAAVMITSDKCYQNNEWVWGYRENDKLGGHDPYSVSKACTELIISSYRYSFFNKMQQEGIVKSVASVRAGNVIGGGDWSSNRIIPDCIRALEEKRPIAVRNPNSTRPWQHVLEPLSGYLLLGAKMIEDNERYCQAWNFGPTAENVVTVGRIVEGIVRQWGEGSFECCNQSNGANYEAGLLSLDISKSNQLLGWHPRWNIDTALEKVVEWYKDYQEQDVYRLCIKQINDYLSNP